MDTIINEGLKLLAGVIMAVLSPMAAKAINRWREKHEGDLRGQVVDEVVRAVEQAVRKEGEELTNPQMLEKAKEKVEARLPWLPIDQVETAVKAAVNKMNAN